MLEYCAAAHSASLNLLLKVFHAPRGQNSIPKFPCDTNSKVDNVSDISWI
jgi:hypothetical protein